MCTVVIHRRPGHDWPLLLAANRDEMKGRPAKPPGRHWPDRPEVRAGLDDLAGGSWMGVNDWGVVACILNRQGTLGPEDGKRSRGELVLEALEHADALVAAAALRDLSPAAYRPFNLIVADSADAFWIVNDGAKITVQPIREGLSMITARELNDMTSERLNTYLPLFSQAQLPDPEVGDWSDWQMLLASRAGAQPQAGMCFELDSGFATLSSALIALPSPDYIAEKQVTPIFLATDGPPDSAPWQVVAE